MLVAELSVSGDRGMARFAAWSTYAPSSLRAATPMSIPNIPSRNANTPPNAPFPMTYLVSMVVEIFTVPQNTVLNADECSRTAAKQSTYPRCICPKSVDKTVYRFHVGGIQFSIRLVLCWYAIHDGIEPWLEITRHAGNCAHSFLPYVETLVVSREFDESGNRANDEQLQHVSSSSR